MATESSRKVEICRKTMFKLEAVWEDEFLGAT